MCIKLKIEFLTGNDKNVTGYVFEDFILVGGGGHFNEFYS